MTDLATTIAEIDAIVIEAGRLAHDLSHHLAACRDDPPKHGALNVLRNNLLELNRGASIARRQLLEATKARAIIGLGDAADLLHQLTTDATGDDPNRATLDRAIHQVGKVKAAIAAT